MVYTSSSDQSITSDMIQFFYCYYMKTKNSFQRAF